ncbi:MAG: hypothetical protein ACI4XC_03115 [Eubacterium sp.]
MKKVRSRLDLFIIALLSATGCFLRLFQLLRYTDKNTGLVTSNHILSYVIYGLFAVSLVFSLLYSFNVKKRKNILLSAGNKKVCVLLCLLGVAYFCDYIHQCINLYGYISDSSYVDFNYAAILALSGIAALVSCSYVNIIIMLVQGCNFDCRRLGFFHFVPVIWAFLRMIIIMMKIVDFKEDVESFCEFLFLTVFICFSFSVISAVDRKDKSVSQIFTVFGLMTFFSSFVIALPRILAVLTGRSFMISDASFTPILYLIAGLLSATAVVSVTEKDEIILE